MKLPLFLVALFAAITSFASEGGFLFVTFRGEQTAMTEQIYFVLSRDGRNWEALNKGEPVLVSNLGEKGVRDPFLVRAQDGRSFYLLATDLSIFHNRNWGRSTHEGSKSLVIWNSTDLVHWSQPWIVKVAADDAGCTWAPEAVYDEDTHDYLVFWASTTKSDNFGKQRIWAARTRDFHTFSKPFIYIEKPNHVIDTDIVHADGKYFRFSKDETYKAISMEESPKLMGPWTDVPGFSLSRLTGYEGPECYLLEPASAGKPATWCLILDRYSKGTGYKPFVTQDLASGQFTEAAGFTFPFVVRHGCVVPVSETEYRRLEMTYKK